MLTHLWRQGVTLSGHKGWFSSGRRYSFFCCCLALDSVNMPFSSSPLPTSFLPWLWRIWTQSGSTFSFPVGFLRASLGSLTIRTGIYVPAELALKLVSKWGLACTMLVPVVCCFYFGLCGPGICQDNTLYFLCFSFMCFGIPCWKMSHWSQIVLFLARKVETFQSKTSLNSSGMDGTSKWWCGISAPCFPFILMCMVLVFLM